MLKKNARLFAFAIALFLCAAAWAEDFTWTLTTADLRTQNVQIKSLDTAGLKVTVGGDEKSIAMDQFVDLARAANASKHEGKFDLVLAGGERINGEPVKIDNESLVWKNPVVGEVLVPMKLLTALVPVDAKANTDRRRDDEVTLTNKDIVRGAIIELTPAQVVIKTENGDQPLPAASVATIGFASTASTGSNKPSFRVRLDEGSTIPAAAVKLDGAKLELTMGGTKVGVDLARVVQIEQENGPVAFLSNRQPTENVYTPYIGSDQRFVARFNADFDGNPIRFRDRVYARSIAAHSYSRITWPLDPASGYVAFRTRYAMDPKAGQGVGGDVTVRIKLDDKVVHEQANVRPGILSPPIVLDLGQAKKLTLEVDYGQLMHSNDRLNWLEPALLRVKPAETPEPAPAK
jgi:hypothetical protein